MKQKITTAKYGEGALPDVQTDLQKVSSTLNSVVAPSPEELIGNNHPVRVVNGIMEQIYIDALL
ncbi:MAG TPA: hypothetical protein VE978_21060 [Chitinophagales bacterium]|nr:hypothetical protein [Chitinophagales bacterium]